jgi:hypothetical protein
MIASSMHKALIKNNRLLGRMPTPWTAKPMARNIFTEVSAIPKPSLEMARAMPLTPQELDNNTLVTLSALGNLNARKEMVRRHIMSVDGVDYDEASAKFDDIEAKNIGKLVNPELLVDWIYTADFLLMELSYSFQSFSCFSLCRINLAFPWPCWPGFRRFHLCKRPTSLHQSQ